MDKDFLPRKRGPKWQSRRPDANIETQVLLERKKGLSKYEICLALKPKLGNNTPSPSGVYNICKRAGLNKISHQMKEEKRKIIKELPGQLGHIDCHHLGRDIILDYNKKRYYLVSIIDDYSRIVWAEIVEDVKSLTVMFAALKAINMINITYQIQFSEILSDNGSEFSSRGNNTKNSHPFERMLIELEIKHRYTKPYRPQTNGKIERFWRTLNEDLIEGTCFDSIGHFKDELIKYLFYYNQMRPHQSLEGMTPEGFLNNNKGIV
jgi:transposase InsO family protein